MLLIKQKMQIVLLITMNQLGILKLVILVRD
nr:MAG TPA: hypothetical protein [Caudoviricetes sp.]